MKKLKHTLPALVAAVASFAILPTMADLPSGYRQLDYVDTDGSTWVNTLFKPVCTNAVEIKASLSAVSDTQFLFCSRRWTNSRQYALLVATGKTRFDYDGMQGAKITVSAGEPHVFAINPEEDAGQEALAETSKKWTANCSLDGASAGTNASAGYFMPDSKAYFCLFGAYKAVNSSSAAVLDDNTEISNMATCRFYYFKVWDTKDKDNLLCHIVPVYGEVEQAVGLYDLVAGRFLPAHGGILSSSYTLAENEVWLTADERPGEVDLNGHSLTAGTVAKNRYSSIAGAAYQDLEYITATGSEAIQIEGFMLPGTAKVEMKFRPNANVAGTTEVLFCSRTSAQSKTYSCFMADSGYLRFDFNNNQTQGNKVALTVGEDYTLVFDGTTAKPTWSVNGTTEKAHDATSNDFTGGSDLILFGNSLAGTISCRLYYFTVTTNGVTALNLRPARRLSDGVVGLYDAVGGAFYTSGTSTALPGLATPKFSNTSATDSELRVGQKIIPGYTVVECITASDSFIKTGFIPAATDRLEMKASLVDTAATYGLFCSRPNANVRLFNALYFNGTWGGNPAHGIRFDFNTTQNRTLWMPTADVPFTIALDGNGKKAYIDGEEKATFGSNAFTPTNTVYLFALHNNDDSSSNHAKGSIYFFKAIGADGTLKVDMVPAVRDADSVAGLYDRVRRQFYPSATDIAFAAGATLGDGKLYADADCAFDATEIAGNITLVKNGEGAFDGGGTTLAGTLKVNGGTVRGVTLQNGATLDLSDASAPFSLDDNAISFAGGATIYVDVGSRTVTKNTPVVSWTSAPSNIGGLKFRLVSGSEESSVIVKDDGLYFAPAGLTLTFY